MFYYLWICPCYVRKKIGKMISLVIYFGNIEFTFLVPNFKVRNERGRIGFKNAGVKEHFCEFILHCFLGLECSYFN